MYATEGKTAEGFKAVGERVDEIEQNVGEVSKGIVELAATLKSLREQQASYRNAALNRQSGDEKSILVFPDLEMAKAFGEKVITAPRVKVGKAMNETSDGNLVDSETSTAILNKVSEFGVLRRNAMRVTMGAAATQLPFVTSDLTVYSPGEGGEIDESDMGGGQVNLIPRKLACLARYSAELEEDSVAALGELVGQSIARSLARAEDLAGFLGDGTSTYWSFQGISGALRAVDETIANIKSLVVGSGNAYSELVLADFRKVCGLLPASAEANAKWYVSKAFFWNVILPLLWAESAGQPIIGTPTYFEQGPSKFLLGYPVEFTAAMPKTAADSQICALLADLQQSVILGERKALTIARSEHVRFSTDEIVIRGLERISIVAYGVGDTTEAGPICGLITEAA